MKKMKKLACLAFSAVLALSSLTCLSASAYYTQTYTIDNDALASSGYSNEMYKYSTAHTWTKLTGSNHKNNDARKEAADATSLYNWIFNSAVGGSTQNTCTLSAYVNSYLFTATNAIYSIWTDYNRTYGDFHNDVAGYFVHSLDQNAAPAGYSQVGSKGVRGHIDYVEVSGGDTPNLNVGADEIKLVVTY